MKQIGCQQLEIPNQFVMIKYDGTEVFNPKVTGLNVNFQGGHGNYVEIHEGSLFKNVTINISYQSKVTIKKTSSLGLNSLVFDAGGRSKNNKIEIDENFFVSAGGRLVVSGTDNASIKVGRDNMWSSGIVVRASDGHQIFDLETFSILNSAKETLIGDDVWLGSSVVVMKGAKIPNGSVVGQSSIVTQKFDEENVVIVGNPGRIVKHNIGWNQDYVWEKNDFEYNDKNNFSIYPVTTSSSHWHSVFVQKDQTQFFELSRRQSSEKTDLHLQFDLDYMLNCGNYLLIFEFETNVSTKFKLFLRNSLGLDAELPIFYTKKDQHRRIVFPFYNKVNNANKINISASHFPELDTILKIYDLRIVSADSI